MKKFKLSIFYPIGVLIFCMLCFGFYQYRVNNIKHVTIVDETKNYYLNTYAKDVQTILDKCELELGEKDVLVQGMDAVIEDGMKLEILRSFEVMIEYGQEMMLVSTTAETVDQVLLENGLEVNKNDIVEPFIYGKISKGSQIKITKVRTERVKETVDIPYFTEINLVDDLEDTEVVLMSKGENGSKEVEYELVYENDQLIATRLLNETILKEAQNEIKNKGRDTLFVTSRGMPFRYSKILICTATAYDLSFESCGKYPDHPAYGITFTGTQARPGVIAVDPKVIPLKSKVYVESLDRTPDYGFASAEDTGSAIKGNIIDLFIESNREALRYGRRTVRVYILDDEVDESLIKGYGQ